MGGDAVAERTDARRAALQARFPQWVPTTLDGLLDRIAGEFPDRPLVITDDRTLTYAEVAASSRRLADGLAALGVRRGDRVGMLMANYPEFVPLKFAIARAGAVAVPLNFLYRADELRYVLGQSRCTVLVTMTGFAGLDYPAMLDEIAPGWEQGHVESLPELRAVVQLDTDGHPRDGVRTVADLDALGAAHPGAADGAAAQPDDLGDILYTSGTTGSPKGVMVTHDAVQRTGYASALTRAFEDGRRILFSLPCYHMFGYVEGLMAAMFVAGAIIPQHGLRARRLPGGHRAAPGHGDPLRADHDGRAPGAPRPAHPRPVLGVRDPVRRRARRRCGCGRRSVASWASPRSPPATA